ncbi:serine threonine protein kinase [Diplodia corticola]|uniref:EKC/KEOPS complex subunit BUD32 n=1 Tax=Diplodia corticola TaxID=236234 RepID=A0A1J9SA61_9PEZI|nr:serine threonine protein kinase [Diplodia corticola]OJD37375.1 serine threonine protein kinase [Diplodia corticola]
MSFFHLFLPGKSGGREPARAPIPVDQAEAALENLCQPPFTSEKFQRIEGLLVQLDIFRDTSFPDPRNWQCRPRTYTVLRSIAGGNHWEYLDRFVDGNYFDIHLPFDNRTLPGFLNSDRLRDDFLSFQHHVLSPEARSLEIEGGEHQLIPGSADAHFWPLKVLGQGGFGQVDEVKSKLSFNTFARKRVPRRRDSAINLRRQNDFIKEVQILKKLSHRHLVNYVGSYTDNSFIAYLMQPVAKWDLLEFLTFLGDPRNDQKRRQVQPFFGCLASAIDYLHDRSIKHTDITTRNVLVTSQGEVCLSDFGTATDFSQTGRSTTNDLKPFTKDYIAPEIFRWNRRNTASDMWSLGVVFLEITTVLLGNDLSSLRMFMEKHAKNKEHPQAIWANLPTALDWLAKIMSTRVDSANEAITWVKSLLQDDPKNRLTVKNLMVEIQQTPSFRQFCCLHCWPEFEARAFDFETPLNPEGFNETMKHATAAEVSARAAALFEPELPPVPIDARCSQSIENWINNSTSATVDAHDIPLSTWEGVYRTAHRRPSLESLPESMDESEASFATAPPMNTGCKYTKEPTPNPMPEHSPNEDLGVDSGLGYLIEDDRSSDEEDTTTKEKINVAQGFIVEEDSSSSEGSCCEVNLTLEPSRSSSSLEMIQLRPLVQTPGTDPAGPHLSRFSKHEPWDLQMDDSDDYEEEEHSDGWVIGAFESSNRKGLDMDTGKQFVLYRPDIDQEGPKQEAIPDAPHDHSAESPTEPGHGCQSIADASKPRGPWTSDERGSEKFADRTLPSPPPLPPSTIKYRRSSPSITSRISDAIFSGDESGGSETLVTIPSHEQEPKKSRGIRKEVRWVDSLVQEIPRAFEEDDEAPADQKKNYHGTNKQATVENVEDVTEIELKQHQREQTPSDTKKGGDPRALDNPPSLLPSSPKSTKTNSKPPRKGKKHASQPSKTKDTSKEATQQPERTKRVPKPAESPTLFMEEARKAGQQAKSIATSQMTSRTKQALAGYNINRWVDHTNRLLERYCSRGSAGAVRVLLQQKCNPGTKAKPRCGPLLNAIRGASARHSKVVRLLLEYNVDVHVTARGDYNKTPLHLAIENKPKDGYVNMVHDMVFAGVNPNIKDRNGECALEKIFKAGGGGAGGSAAQPSPSTGRGLEKYRLDALALLLLSEYNDGAGTRVNIRIPATRDTPLHLAVRRRSPMAAAMLLHKGADVNAANASGMTPLLSAALMWRSGGASRAGSASGLAADDEQMLDLLTSQPGIKLDEWAGTQRRTALHLAVVAGVSLAVEILLEKGADPRRRDADGRDAMALVAEGREKETGDDEVIRGLLDDALRE